MLEFLIVLPNILAQVMCTINQAFYANLLYCAGYPLFMWRNYKKRDNIQLWYFSFLWVLSVVGVVAYLMGWNLPEIFKEMF